MIRLHLDDVIMIAAAGLAALILAAPIMFALDMPFGLALTLLGLVGAAALTGAGVVVAGRVARHNRLLRAITSGRGEIGRLCDTFLANCANKSYWNRLLFASVTPPAEVRRFGGWLAEHGMRVDDATLVQYLVLRRLQLRTGRVRLVRPARRVLAQRARSIA